MKLNKQGKDELRTQIEEQLKSVPDGQKVHLDKDLLENLLFETITYNKFTNEQLKLPIWAGEFLRKLDLSEVSFEDVAWSLVVADTYDYPEEAFIEFMDEETYKNMPNILPTYNPFEQTKIVDYSMTNAKIDFKKSFEFKKTGKIRLLFCDFNGVDLSNNDMSSLTSAFECDLSDTGIVISPEMYEGQKLVFDDTNLRNVDLSKFTISIEQMMTDRAIIGSKCDLTNTGLNLTVDTNEEIWNKEPNQWNPENFLKTEMMPHLVGCYINGKKIISLEEREAIAQEKRTEYETYKQGIFDSVYSSIEEQTSHIKR